MQGHTVCSEEGGEVRVIDYIKGRTLSDETEEFPGSHETYFRKLLPSLLEILLPCPNALHALQGLGERYGDVRTDHLMLDKETGKSRCRLEMLERCSKSDSENCNKTVKPLRCHKCNIFISKYL